MSACPACGAGNRAGARFCDQCGTVLGPTEKAEKAKGRNPVADGNRVLAPAAASPHAYTPRHLVDKVLKHRDAMQGERKRVTVLFADIAGSTAIAEKAGAEGWHQILDGFFDLLSSAVHRYEGTVNQYTGDGIMALFGAPIAHEDHAQRACLAAVCMQREMARYVQEVRARHTVELGMRVGLNSGEVVVGRIGDDLRMDYTAQGLTVNLAQRLEGLCTPGRILVSRATGQMVRDRFKLLDLGERTVAGAAKPVGVYELQGEASAEPTSWTQTLFVGRERELGELEAARDGLKSGGRGAAVTLVSGPGLGKTRLCWEFGRRCAAAGVPFHRTHCLPYTRALSLWPIRRLARERLGIPEHAAAADIRAIAEAEFQKRPDLPPSLLTRWLEFLGANDEVQALTTQGLGLRKKLIDLVTSVLLDSKKPQVLVVEDLHWADSASEEFLQRLVELVPGSRTLLLLDGRAGVSPQWLEACNATHLRLSELAGNDLGKLAEDWLGADPSVAELLPKLSERTLGNPFFLEQAVRDLEQSGYLRGTRGAYQLVKPVTRWQIPDTVHGLLAARIDRLPSEQKPLLQAAAVIGARFTVDLLAEITGAPVYEVLGRLGGLESAGFVRRSMSGVTANEFGFCHPLMQEVAYGTQLESRRKAIHLRLAESLELRYPQNGRPCEEWTGTAHHFECADEFARAGQWNLRAVGWAARWDAEVLLEQARAAVANLDRAGDGARTAPGRIEARAALIRAGVHTAVPAEEVEQAYREGQDLALDIPNDESHAELVLSYGLNRLHRGDADAAAELTAKAAKLRIASGRRDWPGPFLDYVLYAHNTAGRLEEGMALARQLVGADWVDEPVHSHNYVARAEYAAALTYRGKLREAQALLEEALAEAEGDDNTSAWINAFLVDWAVFTGSADGAMQRARNALACADAFGSAQSRAFALCALGEAHLLTAQHAQAVAALEQAEAQYTVGTAGYLFRGLYLATLGEAYRGHQQPEKAAAAAEAGIALTQTTKARIQELQNWSVLLALPREGPWKERAGIGLKRMEELIAFTGATVFVPWWCKWRARWAPSLEQRDHWRRQALEEFKRLGATRHVQRLTEARPSA